MANRGARGRVLDENGQAIAKVLVAAFDVEVITDDVLLKDKDTDKDHEPFRGLVQTRNDGSFEINYSSLSYGLESNPDIVVKFYDPTGIRVIYETGLYEDCREEILDIGDVTIYKNMIEGNLATLGNPLPFVYLSHGNKVEFYIDNKIAWEELTNAVKSADSQIHLLLFYFDVPEYENSPADEIPKVITLFDPDMPVIGSGYRTAGSTFERELLTANKRNVVVRLLIRNVIALGINLGYPTDTAEQVLNYFTNATRSSTFKVREFKTPISEQMHAKVITIDNKTAFIIGSPFLQEYYDDRTHEMMDPRRGFLTSGVTARNQIKKPIHEVSMKIEGDAVSYLEDVFRDHWNTGASNEDRLPAVSEPYNPSYLTNKKNSIQIVKTLPGNNRIMGYPSGETGILEVYLRAIGSAEKFIYLENQYFTSIDIANALKLALLNKPRLQLIMLINNSVDIPFYGAEIAGVNYNLVFDGFQTNLIESLLGNLDLETSKRVGMFTLWSHEEAIDPESLKTRIIPIYIHSKVAIVDDEWATVGSANLDGISLNNLDHLERLPWDSNEPLRETDVNAIIYNNIDGQPATDAVGQLRRMLWAEHLGYRDNNGQPDANHMDLANQPDRGWLALWNEKSELKLAGLKQKPPKVRTPRILQFPHEKGDVPYNVHKANIYLKELGVDTDQLTVEKQVRSFCFKNSRWDQHSC